MSLLDGHEYPTGGGRPLGGAVGGPDNPPSGRTRSQQADLSVGSPLLGVPVFSADDFLYLRRKQNRRLLKVVFEECSHFGSKSSGKEKEQDERSSICVMLEDDDISPKELEEVFRKYGPIRHIMVSVYFSDSERGKCAYIEFAKELCVQYETTSH